MSIYKWNKQRGSWRAVYTLLCTLLALPAFSQVTVNASIDSLMLLIGEQAHVKVEVSCPTESHLIMPSYPGHMVMEGIEILGEVTTDTQYLNKRSHMVVTQAYTITSFDSAFYYIPPFEVLVDSVAYVSNPLALNVVCFDVDTAEVNAIFPIKDVVQRPVTFVEALPLSGSVVLIIALCLLIPYLLGRYHDNKPILRRVTIAPKLPPHQVALQEMDRIKSEKSWQKDDVKQYYTELTDALRQYMEARFGFNAMEMTSTQILKALHSNEETRMPQRHMKRIVDIADYVKFAKVRPVPDDNVRAFIDARNFIEETRPVVQPEEDGKDANAAGEGKPSGAASQPSESTKQDKK